DQLAGGAFATSEVDGCLAVWTPDEFEVRAREMKDRLKGGEAERKVARFFFSGAVDVTPDRQGRIALPQHLRDFARLEGDVVVTGQFDHLEIWDPTAWEATRRAGEQGFAAGAGA